MRCACCDKGLSETEVTWNGDCKMWEYCTTCLIAISEIFDDHLTEDEIDEAIFNEWETYEEFE